MRHKSIQLRLPDWCHCLQSRPFGVALLVAGWQEGSGPVLYHTDPSGMFVEHDAKAIGSGSEGAQTTLQVSAVPLLALYELMAVAMQLLVTRSRRGEAAT